MYMYSLAFRLKYQLLGVIFYTWDYGCSHTMLTTICKEVWKLDALTEYFPVNGQLVLPAVMFSMISMIF